MLLPLLQNPKNFQEGLLDVMGLAQFPPGAYAIVQHSPSVGDCMGMACGELSLILKAAVSTSETWPHYLTVIRLISSGIVVMLVL